MVPQASPLYENEYENEFQFIIKDKEFIDRSKGCTQALSTIRNKKHLTFLQPHPATMSNVPFL